MAASSPPPPSLPHVAIFPLMSKGHIIPLIHLARLIHRRHLATLTFFTTTFNAPFFHDSLSGINATIIELPFPDDLSDLPPGVERNDLLPSLSYFFAFVNSFKLLRPHFERELERLPPVSFFISDGFLGWTNESAAKLGIPRIVFFGMSSHATVIHNCLFWNKPHANLTSDDETFLISDVLPHVRLTRPDLTAPLVDPNLSGAIYDFVAEEMESTRKSHGVLVNSFFEMEATYADYWNNYFGPKAWYVGPLCLAQEKPRSNNRPSWIEWLDSRLADDRPVVYVAFGTQAHVSEPQLKEIEVGLERSGLDYLWVVRAKELDLGSRLEERAAQRGMVVEWVDQLEVLRHESVRGFVSHCGWNSVIESISAGVPILAWPMMAEQRLNAKFVVEELRTGLQVRRSDGTPEGLVKGEDFAELVKELLAGEKGKEAAKNAKELANAASKAMDEGGSSWATLELMVRETSAKKQQK